MSIRRIAGQLNREGYKVSHEAVRRWIKRIARPENKEAKKPRKEEIIQPKKRRIRGKRLKTCLKVELESPIAKLSIEAEDLVERISKILSQIYRIIGRSRGREVLVLKKTLTTKQTLRFLSQNISQR